MGRAMQAKEGQKEFLSISASHARANISDKGSADWIIDLKIGAFRREKKLGIEHNPWS